MDTKTEATILKLQLLDIDALLQSEDANDEIDSASLEAVRDELKQALTLNHDRQLAEILNLNNQADSELVAQEIEQARGVVRSHELIRQLEGNNTITTPPAIREVASRETGNNRHRLRVSIDQKVAGDLAKILSGPVECAICFDGSEDTITLECAHDYCIDCTKTLFEDSLKDTSLFPPRCCKTEINLDRVQGLFTQEFLDAFALKKLEVSTLNPTYCIVPTCAQFIRPEYIEGDIATCTVCDVKICTQCKGEAHPDTPYCPQDEAVQQLLQLSREQRWQQCFHCKQMIDLSFGCNHITCRCGTEFCFVCARQWDTCDCPLWDEARLIATAEDRVARRGEPGGRANVQEEVARLRGHHDCNHPSFERVDSKSHRGQMMCDTCNGRMPLFIFRCDYCRTELCRRCLHNR